MSCSDSVTDEITIGSSDCADDGGDTSCIFWFRRWWICPSDFPDDPTPQQLREWVLQRARLGGGGFGFLRTAQRRQQSQQETFSPQVLSELFPQQCVTGSVEAAALGASESAAALGASESAAALGARASPATGPSSAEALHTFTLDSGASCCFFCNCTTRTPLAAPVPVSLADPIGGPVVVRAFTVLPCLAVPFGSLSGLHLPTFSTNLVSNAAIQDVWVDTFIPGGQRVAICTCSRTGRHLATFSRRPGSSLYTLTTASTQMAEAGEVVASSEVSVSGQLAASCSCRVLSHQTLLWHHRLGYPSLQRIRSMHSCPLVSGLPRSLPSLSRSPAPPCLPCIEGRQRAAPHSSEFHPTTTPLQTLHMDVWGRAPVGGTDQERYFLLVVDDYSCYTTVFPLRRKADVSSVLIPWIRATRRQLRERFCRDFLVLRLHSDRGGEFSSGLLADFYRDEVIVQSFTLLASPQQNGTAERRIGLIMEVARTSMIHAAAPHFLWPFAVRYAAHQLNLWPRPGGRPSGYRGGGSVATGGASSGGATTEGAGSWGAATGGADSGGPASPSGGGAMGDPAGGPGQPPQPDLLETLSPQAIRAWIVRRGSPGGGGYGLAGAGAASRGGTAGAGGIGGTAGAGGAASTGGTRGAAGAGVAGATSLRGATSAGGARPTSPGGTAGAGDAVGARGTGAGGTGGAGAASPRGARTGGAGAAGAGGVVRAGGATGAAGAGGAGATGAGGAGVAGIALRISIFYPQPQSSMPPPDSVLRQSLTERREPENRASTPVHARRVARPRPPPVPGTHGMALRPSSVPQHIVQPEPPASPLSHVPDPVSDLARVASPAVTRLLATVVTDPDLESTAAFSLVTELVDFAAGLECLAAALPRFASMLLCPEGDPDALDIPTPHSYAEAIAGEYSSQWQTAMDIEMASWKSTCTYVNEIPPLGANIVDGMWIFRVKRPPGSPPVFRVSWVLQRFGFQFSSPQPTPMSTDHSLSAPPSDESVEPSGPYPELVGCLMYLMTCTRPDLAYPLSLLARYVAPGLSDPSWADDQVTQCLSHGYTFSLGSGSVSCRSTPSSVLTSSCEAEIYTEAMAAQELRWLTYLLTDLGERPRSPPVLYVDNKAMLALCHEQRLEHRTKHIALCYFLARELQERRQLRLSYVVSQSNTANVFTKALGSGDHQRFCTALGLVPTLPHLLVA
ncbi:unnamed protein product [Closterium sp. NIES-54]